MKLNFKNVADTDSIEFFNSCGLEVSGLILVYTLTGDQVVTAAWKQDGKIIFRSQETGNIVKDIVCWAALSIPYLQ